MSSDYMRKYMNIVTEDDINPKNEEYAGRAALPEELKMQKLATEKVADKISEIFKKHTSAHTMPGANKLPNNPGELYRVTMDKSGRDEMAIAHFHIPVVYGERADKDATNSWKRVRELYSKLVHPLRSAGFLASNPGDAGHMPRKNQWKDPNSDAGGFTAEFLVSAPVSKMSEQQLQKVLSWLSSQG